MKNEEMTGWKVATLNDKNIWEIERTGLKHDQAVSYAAYNNLHGKPSKTIYPDEGYSLKGSKMIEYNTAVKHIAPELGAEAADEYLESRGITPKLSKMIQHNIEARKLQEEIDAIEGKIESLQYLKKELIFDRDS